MKDSIPYIIQFVVNTVSMILNIVVHYDFLFIKFEKRLLSLLRPSKLGLFLKFLIADRMLGAWDSRVDDSSSSGT